MARKITQEAVNAFLNAQRFNKANMQIEVTPNETIMRLHDNPIAYKYPEGKICIQNCGWFSNTTKERLNAIPGVRISQIAGVWYLNNSQWDGKLIDIN